MPDNDYYNIGTNVVGNALFEKYAIAPPLNPSDDASGFIFANSGSSSS
jgi:hypothetical protein